MSENTVTRRSLLTTTAALSTTALASTAAAAPQQRRPVVTEAYQVATGSVKNDPLKIVTMYKFAPHELQKLKSAAPNTAVDVIICSSRDEFRTRLRDAEVVYGGINGADLDYAPKLQWVQAGGAGVEGMDDTVRNSPVVMTNYARTFAPGISETAIGLLLALTHRIGTDYARQFERREWKPVGGPGSDHHVELINKTMGIVGLGGIGAAIARRAYYGFDMRIVATDAKPIPTPEYVAELHDPSWFPQMVPQLDVLVAAAPSTPQTVRMFNEDVFRRMKKTAYFIAVSRGNLFDDMALVKALKERWIAGAGLDVMPQEPPPSNHPIYECDNVVITPHTSGWSPDRQVRLIDLFAENIRRYATGAPLINVVDKKAGY
jgi:phosphoglycerate dehydrogenase-like enzyme